MLGETAGPRMVKAGLDRWGGPSDTVELISRGIAVPKAVVARVEVEVEVVVSRFEPEMELAVSTVESVVGG